VIDVEIEQRFGSFHLSVAFRAEAPIVGLFGRSGSGKTSVVNAIAGITRPLHGSIAINGNRLFDSARKVDVPPEDRRIGYVFQDGLLFPHLDVKANLLYGHRLRRTNEHFIEQGKVVALLGLESLLNRKTNTLSGGEKQRVAIGRALLAQPRIILFDEPLASLDVPRKLEVIAYIERLREELRIPMIYVSHSATEITRLADTVVILSDGKCLAVGSTDQVMGRVDLTLATGRDEVGSIIETRIVEHHFTEQLTTLGFDGGKFIVPRHEAAIGQRIRCCIRARDVALATHRPTEISVLNILPGRVTSIDSKGRAMVEVGVALGTANVTARITRRSLQDLRIEIGQEIYALIKAVSFDETDAQWV